MIMTFEELKAEAKRQGYNLIKNNPVEKLLPCTCGCNRRERWTAYSTDHSGHIKLVCERCGKYVYGKTEREVRHNWNEAIKIETNKIL